MFTDRRGDKFNLTSNGRRLLSKFLDAPEATANQTPSAKDLNDGTKMDNEIVADKFKNLVVTYNNILRMCCDALEEITPQVQRDGLRESIKELMGTSGYDSDIPSDGRDASMRLNNVINLFSHQLKNCYEALSEVTPQTERDALRDAIVGYLKNK
jgi:hypothetical protein